MNKLIILSLLLIQGCGILSKTEYVKVSYPILVCPEPPVIERPKLYINKLTMSDIDNYEKVAKYYDITLQQLTNHIDKLELILKRYNKTSESYKELQEEVNKISLPDNDGS